MSEIAHDEINENDNTSQSELIEENGNTDIHSDILDNKDEFSDDEAQIPVGVTDTMFTATDFLEDNERQNILNVALAEGNRPLSVFRDKNCEELPYPFLDQHVLKLSSIC